MTSVLVADDHNLFRQGLVKIVESHPSFEVTGEAADGLEALKKIDELKPVIAILDISMPKVSGLDVVRQVNKTNSTTQFIILTMHKDDEFLNEALDLGVKGYILKENTTDDLIAALRAISVGGSYISPLLSPQLITIRNNRQNLAKKQPSINELTVSERRVLKLLSENKTSKEIAQELNLSFRTVQNHRGKICLKLGLKGANMLLQFAIENKSAI